MPLANSAMVRERLTFGFIISFILSTDASIVCDGIALVHMDPLSSFINKDMTTVEMSMIKPQITSEKLTKRAAMISFAKSFLASYSLMRKIVAMAMAINPNTINMLAKFRTMGQPVATAGLMEESRLVNFTAVRVAISTQLNIEVNMVAKNADTKSIVISIS